MAGGFTRREPFNSQREFVCLRTFKFKGRQIPVNEHFDKAQCDNRLLRLLYESRNLLMMDKVEEDAAPRQPTFENLPIEALQDWLKQNGVIPRAGATKDRLATRCVKLWEEQQAAKLAA